MKVTLPEFGRAGVMVVGDVILDRYWYGPAGRISPEAPAPMVKVNTIEGHPGGAANVAMNIASLGANACLVGLTDIDDVARALSKSLADVNVKYDFASVPTHLIIIKLRVLFRSQQLIRLGFEEGFEGVGPQSLHERINQALSSTGALVLSDCAEGALTSIQQMIQLACKTGVPVLIDPRGTDSERYRGAMLLTPNLSEFEAVASKCEAEEEIVGRSTKLIADYELSALLVTRFEQGMSLLQPGKTPLHIPTQTREVYDATGADDTVIGVLAAALTVGNSLEEACFFASAVAGVVVSKLGTSTVLPIESENAARGHTDTGFGVMTEEELKFAVAAARRRGEKVVMTNGVFDILHTGHVSYLTNAHKLGDRLIVAVSSDVSTKQLKGDSRPANPLERCMIVLGALEAVSWVVSLEEDMPQRLIAGILPNLLVKGGGYKPEEIAGSKKVQASSGEALVFNSEDGCSTTDIIKKVQLDKKGQLESGSQISLRSRQIY